MTNGMPRGARRRYSLGIERHRPAGFPRHRGWRHRGSGPPMQLATDRMLAEVNGPIGTLYFNNPARLNALSLDMWQALPVILDAFQTDPRVRAIVVRGAGEKAFVAGADV